MNTNTPRQTITHLFTFLLAQGNTDYLGERVSQLQHSLQCAHLAHSSPQYKSDPEVIIAALLHDVGRFIPSAADMPVLIAPDGAYIGRASHEVLGERYLRQLGFSERVCQLVGSHVMAKRFLTATEGDYYDALSETSKKTLVYQGGTFTEEQISLARRDPWLDSKLAVRRWDDQAKDPELRVPDLAAYEEMAVQCLVDSRSQVVVVSRPYPLPMRPVLIIVLPESLFSQSLHSNLLSGMKDRDDWIVTQFHHARNGNRPPVEEEVLDQLARRGVQVVEMSADIDIDSCPQNPRYDADTCDSLSRLASTDATGRSRIVLQNGLSMLQRNQAEFAYLSLAAELGYTQFSEMLEELKGDFASLDAIVAITADCSQEETKGLTVFDAVLKRASPAI